MAACSSFESLFGKGSTFFANEGFIACQRRKLLELKIRYCIGGRTVHM